MAKIRAFNRGDKASSELERPQPSSETLVEPPTTDVKTNELGVLHGQIGEQPVENDISGSMTGKENEQLPLPDYISETVTRVNSESSRNFNDFLRKESFKNRVALSVEDRVRMELLINEIIPNAYEDKEKTGELISQAQELIPLASDYIRGKNRDPKSRIGRREGFVNDIYRSSIFELGGQKEFDAKVKEVARQRGESLIQHAVESLHETDLKGDVLVISAKPEDVISILNGGTYTPTLDRHDLGYQSMSGYEKNRIEEALQADPHSELYDLRFTGMQRLSMRYAREIELGLYPREGEESHVNHPVYGQMVVNEKDELKRARQEGYGNVHIRFKTGRIKNRTTFVSGDSLNDQDVNVQLGWDEAVKARQVLNSIVEDGEVDWRLLPPYIEANVMGGVTTDDIEEIVFESDETTRSLEDYLGTVNDEYVKEVDSAGLTRVKL